MAPKKKSVFTKEDPNWIKYLAKEISENAADSSWPNIDPTKTDFEQNLRFVASLVGSESDGDFIVARFRDGVSITEIAEQHKTSAQTVSSRISNVLNKARLWPYYEYLVCGPGDDYERVSENRNRFLTPETPIVAITLPNNNAPSAKISLCRANLKTIQNVLDSDYQSLISLRHIGKTFLVNLCEVLSSAGFDCAHLAPPEDKPKRVRTPDAPMVFIGKGTCKLGTIRTDEDGNIEHVPPCWTPSEDGGSVAVGQMYARSKRQIGSAEIFGDWDAFGYLNEALRLLAPGRPVNIPDLKAIHANAFNAGQEDFLCEHCDHAHCRDCVIRMWASELREGDMQKSC